MNCVGRSMSETKRCRTGSVCDAMPPGISEGVRKTYAPVTGEPLPMAHVDLLLTLRQHERARTPRRASLIV